MSDVPKQDALAYDVFISHSRVDAVTADRVAAELRLKGFRVFVDMAALASGSSFAEELWRTIQNSRFVLALLSRSYVESRWAQQELRIAMEHELRLASGGIRVVPVRLDDSDMPFLLRDKQPIDLRNPDRFDAEMARLIHDLSVLSASSHRDTHEVSLNILGQPLRLDAAASELLPKLTDAVQAFAVSPPALEPPRPEQSRHRTCFVVMPFGREDLNVVYEDFIKPVIQERCRLACVRGDDLFGSNAITDDIRSSIARAQLVIADLTDKNANVFYEVGIAHALDTPVLLLAQSTEDVPFDLRHRRVLLYQYSPRGCKKLETILAQHVAEMLHGK